MHSVGECSVTVKEGAGDGNRGNGTDFVGYSPEIGYVEGAGNNWGGVVRDVYSINMMNADWVCRTGSHSATACND